jgi:hypothetical protein
MIMVGNCSFTTVTRLALGQPSPPLYPTNTGIGVMDHFPTGREVHKSTPPSAKVTQALSYSSIPLRGMVVNYYYIYFTLKSECYS